MVFLFFALGAIAASFAGVVAARLYTGQGFLAGRSRCDYCGFFLGVGALVPIASYLYLGARANCCGARLSILSPLSEIILGALFALAYLRMGLSPELFFFLVALTVLSALVLYDFSHQILPPVLLFLFIVMAGSASYMLTSSATEYIQTLVGAFLVALFFALVHLFSRGRAIGLADAPLSFGLALLAGPMALSGFLFSFWIGAVIGIIILARRPRGSRMGVEVPFAPYLAAGFLLAYFTQWNIFALLSNITP